MMRTLLLFLNRRNKLPKISVLLFVHLTIYTTLFFALTFSFGQSIQDVRKEFHQAVLDSEKSRSFHEYVTAIENPDVTTQAYQAVAEAMLAQVVWNPFSKLSQIMKYDKQIKKVVEMDPYNVEVRFLRLAIEFNLPSFLGMSEHIQEDLEIIKSGIKVSGLNIDANYGRYIFYFLKHTELCSEEDLQMMESTFNNQLGR